MSPWALLLLVWAQSAVTPEQHLNRARTCYGVLDFTCADQALAQARAGLGGLSQELKEETWRLSAEVALSEGRTEAALIHLVALLTASPRFAPRPGAWPPVWLQALEDARQRVPDQRPPNVRLWAPEGPITAGTPLLIRAQIEDQTGVDRAELLLPSGRLTMTSTGGPIYTALLGAGAVQAPGLRLAVRAMDLYGRVGYSPEVFVIINEIPIPTAGASVEAGGPAWWVWAVAGVVVVAGALTVALVATSGDDLEPVQGKIEWP